MDPTDTREITRFVRDTLGCQCPDEVFQTITLERASTPDGSVDLTRLAIGGRLLVYIVIPLPGEEVRSLVQAVTELGQAERDARGYNRFRLVLVARVPEPLSFIARNVFVDTIGQDDRAHLHVLAGEALPSLIHTA